MKSAVYNEVALVLLGGEADRPSGQMDRHALGVVPRRRAGARQRHRGRARARQGRHLPRHAGARRSPTSAPICRPACRPSPAISARSPASIARRRCTSTSPRCSPTPTRCGPIAATAGPRRPMSSSGMVDLAADELGIDPAELRRRNYIPPDAMPFKTGAHLHLRQRRVREEHGHGARARRRRRLRAARAAARKRGKLRGIGISNTIERAAAAGFEGAEIRFDSAGAATLLSGTVTQGQGHETDLQADRVRPPRPRPGRGALHPGRHRPGVLRRRHRRLALGYPRRLGGRHGRPTRSSTKAQSHRRASAQGRCRRRQLRRRRLLQSQDQPHADHQGGRQGGRQSGQAARRTWRSA